MSPRVSSDAGVSKQSSSEETTATAEAQPEMSWQQQYPPQNPAYPGGALAGYGGAQAGGYSPSAPPAGAYPPAQSGYQQQGYNPQYNPAGAPPSGYPGGPAGGAPGYGAAGYGMPGGPPPGIQMDLWNWFQAVDADRTGKINATELRSALMNGNNTTFSEGTCRLMIRMFDRDQSGQIDIHEFASLWKYIQDWRQCFERFDNDRSGSISADELNQALVSFGYRLSPQFCQNLVRIYSARKSVGSAARNPLNSIVFDDFIEACVTIKNLTDAFASQDRNRQGVINIGFEQFLDLVLTVLQ